jgi:hypothetical protein
LYPLPVNSGLKENPMKIRTLFIFLFAIILLETANSQNTDFGIWYGLNAEHSLNNKIEFDISVMLRTNNNATMSEQAFIEGGISYKISKHLAVAGSYRFTEKVEYTSERYPRHKLFADIKGTLPAGRFTFTSRLRLQYEKRTFLTDESDKKPIYHGRIRLKAVYKMPSFFINPYAYAESFSPLFQNTNRLIDKSRYAAGFEIRIAAKHSLETEYIFQSDYNALTSYMNIIAINYIIKF